MRLTDEAYKVILDLSNTCTDLCIMTDFSKNGFISKDFDRWLDSVSNFLKFIIKHKPSDLLSSSSQFDYDFSNLGIPPEKFKKHKKYDRD